MKDRVYCLYMVSAGKQVDCDGKCQAENRDRPQIIREHARQGKFDILLVFMFDRIGRIADETSFVVEWFAKNGVRV